MSPMASQRSAQLLSRLSSPGSITLILFLGAAIIFCALCVPLISGRIYIEDDLSAFNLPLRWFYQDCLKHGENPTWMPSMFCGFDLHGEGQAGLLHPLHFLLYRFLPLQAAYNLELLISYPLFFLGIFLLLRRWRISRHGASFSALLFTFCGFNITNYIHIMIPSIISHVPWLLLCIDVAVRTESRRVLAACSLGVTFLTASQFLLGFPQCVYLSCLVEGFYVLVLLAFHRNYFAVAVLAAAKILSMLVGAAQILPQLDAASHSIRLAPSFEFVMAGSMHPANLLQFFSPYLFNRHGWTNDLSQFWDPPYFGAVAPVLLMWLFVNIARFRDNRRLIFACALFALFGLVLALGEYGYLYRLAAHVPLLGKFRYSSRHVLLFHFALTFLLAVAFADLVEAARHGEKRPRERFYLLWLPAAFSLVMALTVNALRAGSNSASFLSIDKHLAPTGNVWMGPLLLAIATVLAMAAARGRRLAVTALVLFALGDVALYSLRHKPSMDLDAFIAGIEVPAAHDGYRLDPDYRPHWAYTGPTMKGYRVVQGYAALNPNNELDYYNQVTALRVAGVKWRKSRYGSAPELAEAADRGIAWLEVPDPMPRARMLSNVVVSKDPYHDIERVDIASTALVEASVSLSGEPGAVNPDPVVDRPGDIIWDVSSNGRQLFVIAERYHAGWRATVDGESTPVLRANGDFMSCVVPEGNHRVQLRFAPRELRVGIYLTLVGALLTIFFNILVASLRVTRKQP